MSKTPFLGTKKGCVTTAIVITLCAWFSSRRLYSPIISMEKFYVPALDKGFSNNYEDDEGSNTISFDLKNKNGGCSVYYDSIDISLYYYYHDNNNGDPKRLPIGNVSIPGFYQRPYQELTHRFEKVQTFGVPWKEASSSRMQDDVTNGSSGMFLVYLDTNITMRFYVHDNEMVSHERLRLGVNVSVNDQGMKTVPGSLRLTTSASSHIKPCSILILVFISLVFTLVK